MTPLVPRCYKTVPGRSYGTPKELWGFRTAAVRGIKLVKFQGEFVWHAHKDTDEVFIVLEER
jgi:mannose-6-phosphate isomerase-like protein (cupin superfamily)